MTCLEWLRAFAWCPSIEGRDLAWASMSERRRQLQNKAWTIRGFKITESRGLVDWLEPIETKKPGPDDPFPDVLAEVTLCKGAKRQTSFYFHELLSNALSQMEADDGEMARPGSGPVATPER